METLFIATFDECLSYPGLTYNSAKERTVSIINGRSGDLEVAKYVNGKHVKSSFYTCEGGKVAHKRSFVFTE